ncbi:MAG: hypothetical protein WAW96_01150 [Alphaproteobacteria bacterium]
MQFLAIYKPEKPSSGPPAPGQMEKMGKFVEQSMRDGTLITTGSISSAAKGARVFLSNGRVTVLDGAGSEGKAMAGFAILKTQSKEEMVDLVTQFLRLAGDGESEVHLLNEF